MAIYVCTVCGLEKFPEEMSKINENTGRGRCKLCVAAYMRKWKKENRELVNEYNAPWVEKQVAYAKAYRDLVEQGLAPDIEISPKPKNPKK